MQAVDLTGLADAYAREVDGRGLLAKFLRPMHPDVERRIQTAQFVARGETGACLCDDYRVAWGALEPQAEATMAFTELFNSVVEILHKLHTTMEEAADGGVSAKFENSHFHPGSVTNLDYMEHMELLASEPVIERRYGTEHREHGRNYYDTQQSILTPTVRATKIVGELRVAMSLRSLEDLIKNYNEWSEEWRRWLYEHQSTTSE